MKIVLVFFNGTGLNQEESKEKSHLLTTGRQGFSSLFLSISSHLAQIFLLSFFLAAAKIEYKEIKSVTL